MLLLKLGLLPRICLSTYKSRKRKAKEKPFNFLLQRFENEINQCQMKSTIESKREFKKKNLNLYLINEKIGNSLLRMLIHEA